MPPDHPEIRWLGRVDLQVPASPRLSWSGTGFFVEFHGTGLVATLETFSQPGPAGTDRYAVRVDRGEWVQREAPAGRHELVLAAELEAGRHTVEVRKVTEAMVGTGALYALTLPPRGFLRNPHPGEPRRIEVVGGPEACGYGVRRLEKRPDAGFVPADQDYLMAWPHRLGEQLAAEVQTVCYSGRGVLRGQTEHDDQLPELWTRSLAHEPDAAWPHARFSPQVVILQLGAEDLAAGPPPRRVFRAALDRWIRAIREAHPDTWIVLTRSPTVTESWPEGGWGPDWLSERFDEQLAQAEGRGDLRVRVVEVPRLQGPWGTDYQPTASAQAALARHLARGVEDLGVW